MKCECGEELVEGADACSKCGAAVPGAASALHAASGPVMTAEQAPYVEMETSLGIIVFELYWQYAPLACQVRRHAGESIILRTCACTHTHELWWCRHPICMSVFRCSYIKSRHLVRPALAV